MTEYFKLIENYIKDIDISYSSIKDLTIDLAISGGYYRDNYKFKCGSIRERTMYKTKFDSKLVALWLLFYKKLFISKLYRYPELKDFYVFIINKTFFITMSCINLSKLDHDDIVNKYVNLALSSRIKEVLGKLKKSDNKNIVISNKEVFNNNMLPLDIVDFYKEDHSQSLDKLDLEIDIRNKLKDNKLGIKLLDYMLNSTKKIDLHNIDKCLNLSKSECTEENKVVIVDAFNIIKYMLLQYSNSDIRKRFRKVKVSSIKYSFEK